MAASAATRFDVAVIGGGIVGVSTALQLQMRGQRVCVIDPGDAWARCSFGNAGSINHCSILTVASPSIWGNLFRYALNRDPSLRIRWRSLPQFARWLPRFLAASRISAWRAAGAALGPLTRAAFDHHLTLAQAAGAETLLRRSGYLKLYRREATFAATTLECEIFDAAGVKRTDLDARALHDFEPTLKPVFPRARYFPDSGSVDTPGKLVDAYWQAFLGRGGASVAARVRRIRPVEGGVELETMGSERLAAQHAVVAAGAASSDLLDPLGLRFPLAAERGYHARVRLADGAAMRTPFHDVCAGFAGAPIDGGVRIVSGIELAGRDDPPDPSQLETAIANARDMLPLEEGRDEPVWLGSRPSIADGLPVIGEAPGIPRLFLAFGHGHIGLSTGPITGRIIADMIGGAAPVVPVAPFRPSRF